MAPGEYKPAHGGNISFSDQHPINGQDDRQVLTPGTAGSDTYELAALLLVASALAVRNGVPRRKRNEAWDRSGPKKHTIWLAI